MQEHGLLTARLSRLLRWANPRKGGAMEPQAAE
jgi:hypothetical protein